MTANSASSASSASSPSSASSSAAAVSSSIRFGRSSARKGSSLGFDSLPVIQFDTFCDTFLKNCFAVTIGFSASVSTHSRLTRQLFMSASSLRRRRWQTVEPTFTRPYMSQPYSCGTITSFSFFAVSYKGRKLVGASHGWCSRSNFTPSNISGTFEMFHLFFFLSRSSSFNLRQRAHISTMDALQGMPLKYSTGLSVPRFSSSSRQTASMPSTSAFSSTCISGTAQRSDEHSEKERDILLEGLKVTSSALALGVSRGQPVTFS
mmetsp:Transcript_103871/g.294272  ORF Transcript_103871/g.294272 Transcript_103871/m.294272 type:complete len:263 (-) Transcript_103871:1850-2638(-)